MNTFNAIRSWLQDKTGHLNSVIEVIPFVLLTAVIYFIIRRCVQKHRFGDMFKTVRSQCRTNEIIRVLLVCEISAIAAMALSPTNFWFYFWSWVGGNEWNFHLYGFHFFNPIPRIFLEDLAWNLRNMPYVILNVVFFLPLGAALPFVLKKSHKKRTILFGLLYSLLIEAVVQPFIGRDGNIDDFLCNTLGTVLGYLLYLLIKRVFPNFTEKASLSANDVWEQTRGTSKNNPNTDPSA